MMNCKKVFDKEGNVVGMIDSSGKESRLFKAIMGHPAVQSSEDAVSIFKNIYSPKMENVLREIKTNETSQNLSELYLEKNDFDNNGEVKLDSLIEIAQERINIERTSKRDGSWMTAPNGEKTNLNEHQWVSTRTGRFKNWFGDWENKPETASKVVDENGEPLVMYHATRGDFSAFDPLRSFEGAMHFGSILASNYRASVIDIYKPREGQWKSTIPVFLNIKNIVRTYDFYGRDEITRDILHERSKTLQEDIARATEEGQVFSEFIKAEEFIEFADQYTEHGKIENSRDFDLWLEEQKSLTGLEGEALKENIRKRSENLKKYKEQENLEVTESDKIDGAVYTNLIEAPGEVSYVVLDPSNIKSALSNQGTYSESFNNIQKQVSEATEQAGREAAETLVNQLSETGLADNVHLLSNEGMAAKIKELGHENITQTVNGFVHNNEVYLNREAMSLDTPIHEFSHVYLNSLKTNRAETYERGIELVNQELAKEVSEISEVIDFVKRNQPNLEGEALAEEVLAQLIGERGVELLENNADKKTGIVQWLRDAFEAIKELLGLSSMTNRQVMELTLQEYADAVAVDLLSREGNITLYQKGDKGFVVKEVERIKTLNKTAEDGATLNVDGSLYEGVGLVVPATSQNLTQETLTPEKVADFLETHKDKIGSNIVKLGFYKFKNSNQVSIDLNIIAPPEHRAVVLEFGRLAGQESLFDLGTFENIKTGATGENPINFTSEQFREISEKLSKGEMPSVFETTEQLSPEEISELFEADRKKIDEVDGKIVDALLENKGIEDLLKTRQESVNNIARIKHRNNLPILDSSRETSLLNKISDMVTERGENPSKILERYEEILSESKKSQAELIKRLEENKSSSTQEFFSDVVTGKSEKFIPKSKWSPQVELNERERFFNSEYDKYRGNFDEHIATSIPTFRETQIKVGSAIVNMYSSESSPLIYDIGGSEGGFVKAITSESKGKIRSINLDANPDMEAAHNRSPVEKSTFVNEAFAESFELEGKKVKRHVPQEKADVVHESMTFQFIKKGREGFVKEVKDLYLKEDGIFLTEEKLVPKSEKEWKENERLKDNYKLKYYSQEQLGQKSEEVLEGMRKNQAEHDNYVKILKENFKHVARYWKAGNFYGYVASNNKVKVDQFLEQVGGEIKWSPGEFSSETADIRFQLEAEELSPTAPEEKLNFKNRANDQVYDSYREALNSEAKEIETGFETPSGEFIPVKTTTNTTDPKTFEGFANSFIKQGVFKDTKRVVDGRTYFEVEGGRPGERRINTMIVQDEALVNLGWQNFKKDKYGFQFQKAGQEKTLPDSQEKAMEGVSEEILSENKVEPLTDKAELPSDKDLKLSLMDFLDSIGVDTMSISDYVAKYRQKHGVDPSAKALADISNSIIAFKNGEVTLESLSEETAHFIVEGWNQGEIENLLRNIHQTTEYQEFASHYREIYSKKYKGEELDQAVRREILGKVLHRAFLENFNSNYAKTDTHRNIIQRLADLFRSFIEKVRSLVSPKHETELRQFTDQVIENLYRGELKQHINTENFTSSPFVLYKSGKESSMLKSAKTETIQALRMLRTNINALRGTVGQSQADKIRIDRQVLELERVEEDLINRQTVNELAAIADSQVNHIRDIIESNTSGAQTSFTSEINSVYEMLKLNLLPTIVRITSNLKNNEAKYPQKEWNDIVSELERVSTNIQQLDPVINALHERNMDAITERIMLKFNLGSWYKDHIKAIVETAQKDTSYFHRHFGQINNSRNPYLGTLSEVIERTYFNSGQESHLNLKKWQIALEEAGYTTQDLKSLVDGSYYVAPQNESLKEDVMNRLSALIRLKVTGDETSTVQDIIKKAEQNELSELAPQQKADYNRILSEMSSQLKEQPWVDQYYKDRNERWENLNISKETQSIISAYSQDRFNILRETRDEDGVNDLTKLSESEREALESIRKRRKNDKSFYNDDGSLKEGIGVVTNIGELNFPKYDFLREQEDSNKAFYFQDPISNMVYYIMDPKYIEGTSARIAMDLNKLDADYINQNKKGITESKELPELFKKGLQTIQTKHENAIYENKGIERESATENQRREVERLAKEEAFQESLEFVELNSTLSFSEKFWEDLNKSDSFEERSRYLIEQLTDKDSRIEASFTWRDLKRRLAQRSAIVRLYKKSNAPHEIDANNLSRSTKDRIKELDDAIASGKNKLNNIFLRELDESAYTEFSSSATSDLNQAYREATKNMTISEELRFALENASERGKQKINDFLSAKRRGSYTSYQKAFIENQEPGVIDKNNPEELVYARSQVASYYKRFAPNELSETLKLKEESTDINTYLESITSSENLQLNPHFSFLEDTSINMKNPKFDSNYKGEWLAKEGNISYQTLRTDESGKLIFKKGPNGEKVLDPNGVPVTETTNESVNFEGTRYKELFGEDGKKNPRLKKIYDVFMEQKQASFDNYGIDGYSNLYLLPQIYQTGLDRALQTAKRASVKGVKQGIEQFFMHREDDIAYGEKVQDFAKDINVIPKYYVNRLKNQEELSREIEWTQALMYQQSVLFKHRKNNIAEALAIKNALENVNRTSSRGKEAKVTMDMFENYLDYAFYGQKETIDFKVNMFGKEVDVTKSARMLLDYVKFRNMGFNSIVSVTSWLTSEVSLRIEKAVGEIMNSDASNMATRKFSQMLTDALKDTGKLHAKSDLMNQMEFFGVYDPLQRLKNPTFKWLPRMLQQVGWGIQQAADFPISPRAMLSVMMDNRVVNGKIMNYNTFKLENPKLTKKQAKEEWRKYANLTVQDFLDISDRTVKFNESIKDLLDEKLVGDKDAYLELTMERLSANVKRVVSQLNQLIPESQKVAAQRHFAMNYLMTHKSWLSIVLSNRTKNGHFNTSTGLWEEGTYRTFFKFAETAIKEMTSKGFIKSLKDTWNGADIPDDVIGENGEVIPQNELNIPKQMLLTTRRRNMRRMLVDLGWVLGIAGLSYGLMALADNDEDDNYALQMSAYLSLRLLNQVTTMGTAIPNQMVGTLESPFVGLNVVKDMLQMPVNMFNSSIVQQGKFKGDSVRWAELQKTVPGLKTFGDLKNLEHSFDSYYYFNRTNLLWSPAAILDLMYNSGE